MNFPEILKLLVDKKPGRIDAAGIDKYERLALTRWEKMGWTVTVHEGEISEAISAAVSSALKGNADMLFCSGADNLKIIRMINRQLEQSVPGEFDPLSIMQALEVPTYPKLMWVGITPFVSYHTVTSAIKGVQRMVKTLDELGEPAARVALLSCVETISPGVTSTVWEATLAHMSARGQFGKARVDGPLGLDLAVSPEAVTDKGVKTDVNGQADLLIPPDLNSFTTLVDAIHLTGDHDAAGIIVGGPVPIAIPPHRSARHVELSLQIAAILA